MFRCNCHALGIDIAHDRARAQAVACVVMEVGGHQKPLPGQLLDKLGPGDAPVKKEPPKLLSMDHSVCNVTLTDLFEAEERRSKRSSGRIR
jgi:hypothetical protein